MQIFEFNFNIYKTFKNNKNDFIIEFDEVCKYIGFSRIDHAKRLLIKEFIDKNDYIIILPPKGENVLGRKKEKIMLNIKCFKKFCLVAATKPSKILYDYYITLEEIIMEYMEEQFNNQKKMKRILVTGGAGFLGSFLCEKLLAMGNSRGDEVISLDNYFSGSKKNIEHLLSNPRFEAIRHDVTQPIHLEIDEIYNLACPASPIHYQHNPVHTTKTCVMGAINMLELARNVKAKIIQASTSEIYGDPLVHPQNEEYFGNVNTIGARSCYDEGKRVAETLFYDYHRQYGVEIKIVRIFNTYGPRMAVNDGRVVSNFIIQALKGDEITIYGDGKQTRSFCYVDDLIDGITNFMNLDSKEFGPINLGNPSEFTILELAEKIIKLTKSRSKIIFKSLPQNDPLQRKPVIEKAQKLINFSPKIDLETGLEKTITYFKQTI